MPLKILENFYTLSLVLFLAILIQANSNAATIVLTPPIPLQAGSIAHLKPKSQAEDQDRWSLVFFGFAHCKEVCPVSMAKLSMLVKAAAKEQIKLNGVFITIDPDRDTDEILTGYTKGFGSDIRHLRLEGNELEDFKTSFGVEAVFYTKNAGNTLHYQVDHSSTAFLIDPHGKIRLLFDAQDDAAEVAKMFQHNKALFKL
jgi:protein SCO1/2